MLVLFIDFKQAFESVDRQKKNRTDTIGIVDTKQVGTIN